MSDNLDRALEVLDHGLQRTEHGFGADRPGRCWRCRRAAGDGLSELCPGCRAYLLGDGPDPIDAPAEIDGLLRPEDLAGLARTIAEVAPEILERLVEILRPFVDAIAEALIGVNAAGERLVGILDDFRLDRIKAPPSRPRRPWKPAHRIPVPDLRVTAAPPRQPPTPRRTP